MVIENKVKSIPYAEQLNEYSKGRDLQTTRFILLSLTDPIFFTDKAHVTQDGHTWQWVDYQMLSAELESLMPEGYSGQVVQDYISFVQSLHEIAQKASTIFKTTDNFLNYSPYDELKAIRIHDLFDKWRFAWLSQHLRSRLKKGCQPETHFAMTRGAGLLEIGFVSADETLKVGVQLQGTLLRQFISVDPSIKNKAANYARKLIDDELWFMKNGEPLSGKRGKDEFCSYSGTFLYRYEELKERLSADELCDRIVKMLGSAENALAACKVMA